MFVANQLKYFLKVLFWGHKINDFASLLQFAGFDDIIQGGERRVITLCTSLINV